MSDNEIKKFTLDNGIRCIINDTDCKCHQSVTVSIMFGVGSRDEPKNYYGLTHFAEHMFFKGTKKRPEAQMISSEIDRHGGILNAFTQYDVTCYYVKIDYRKFEVALDVLSDLLFNALFRQKDIDSEKEVVVNELKLYRNDPFRLTDMILSELVFTGTTLEHDIGGDIDTIRSAKRDQFLNFVSHFYRPQNTIVSIAGQVPTSLKKLKSLIAKYFDHKFNYRPKSSSKFKHSEFNRRKLFPKFHSMQKESRFRYKMKTDLDGSYMMLAFPGFAFHTPEYYQMILLSCILGSGMSSRLFVEVREKRGLAYRISTNVESYQDLSILTVLCATHDHDVRKTFQVIWKELEKLKKNGIEKTELQKCKDHLIGEFHLSREDTSYLAKAYAYQTLYFDRLIPPKEYEKAIKKVTRSEVKAMANKLFQKEKLNAAVLSNKNIKLD